MVHTRFIALGAVLAGVLFTAKPAMATSVIVLNPSFEADGTTSDGGFKGGSPNGVSNWPDASKNAQTYNPGTTQGAFNGTLGAVPDGTMALILTNTNVSVSQTLTGAAQTAVGKDASLAFAQANTVYTLTLYVGKRLDTSVAVFDGYSVTLSAGGKTLESATAPTITTTATNSFVQLTLSNASSVLAANDSAVGQALTITLATTLGSGPGANPRTMFDAVSLDASPVPEPTAACGLLLGTGALLRRRQR